MPFNCRLKYKSRRKTQVSIFFIAIMATLVLLAFIVVNIGKTALDKTYTANAADSGALAAASAMATGFNYVADANHSDEEEATRLKNEYVKENGRKGDTNADQEEIRRVTNKNYDEANKHGQAALESDCCGGEVNSELEEAELQKNSETNIPVEATQNNQQFREAQDKREEEMAKNMHEDSSKNTYYHNALYAGYHYNFVNSGIAKKVAGNRMNQEQYNAFMQSITPQSVQNGQPLTFSWVDGAGRGHMVTAIVEIEPANNWNLKIAQDTRAQTDDNLRRDKATTDQAIFLTNIAQKSYKTGCDFPTLCPIMKPIGDALTKAAMQLTTTAKQTYNQTVDGMKERRNMMSSNSGDNDQQQIAYVEDIVHSRTVFSSNFQMHMGGPVKGPRGDIDVPTFYPPVQSSATASFNCNGDGSISQGDAYGDSSPTHEACLVAAF